MRIGYPSASGYRLEPVWDEYGRTPAAKAVADGASVIIPGPGFLATPAHRAGLAQGEGIPVLDTVAIAAKTAETRVDLQRAGVAPSRRIGVYCKPDPAFAKAALARLDPLFTTG